MAIAKRSHPFPYRTRKLSFSAPMVVGGSPPVRVGRRQANLKRFKDTIFKSLFYLGGKTSLIKGLLYEVLSAYLPTRYSRSCIIPLSDIFNIFKFAISCIFIKQFEFVYILAINGRITTIHYEQNNFATTFYKILTSATFLCKYACRSAKII